jgi:hypothetical protein
LAQEYIETNQAGLKLPAGEVPTDGLTVLPADRALKVLAFDSSKNLIATEVGGSSGTILDGAVTTAKLDAQAVTTAKLGDNAVTNAKVADSAIGTAEIQDGSVTNAKAADMAALTVKGNPAGASGDPQDVTMSGLRTMVGLGSIAGTNLTAAPNATVPAQVVTSAIDATDVDMVVAPVGTGAFMVDAPDGAATGGNKRGQSAVDLQKERTLATQVASGPRSGIIGGQFNTASGDSTAVIGGASNTASGTNSVVLGGSFNNDNGRLSSVAHGTYAKPANNFARAQGAYHGGGVGSLLGAAQLEEDVAYLTTSDATTQAIAGLVLDDDQAVMMTAEVVGYQVGATPNAAGYRVRACCKRVSGVGSTALVGTPVVDVYENNAAWDCTVTADNVNGRILLNVVGAAATTIYWVATVRYTTVRRS